MRLHLNDFFSRADARSLGGPIESGHDNFWE
jgi:hypothetical protein